MYFPYLPGGYDAKAASVNRSKRNKNLAITILMVLLLAGSIGTCYLALQEGWSAVWLVVWWALTVLFEAGVLRLMTVLWLRLTPKRVRRPSASAKVLAVVTAVILACVALVLGYVNWRYLSGNSLLSAVAFQFPFLVIGMAIGVISTTFRR